MEKLILQKMNELAALIAQYNEIDPKQDMDDVYAVNDTQFGENTVEIDGSIMTVRIDLEKI